MLIIKNDILSISILSYSTKRLMGSGVARYLFLPLIFCIISGSLKAQLVFHLSNDNIEIHGKSLYIFTAKVVNNNKVTENINLKIVADNEIELITQNEIALDLKPGDSIFIPIKIFNKKDLTVGKHNIDLYLIRQNKIIQTKHCFAETPRNRSAALFVMTPSIQLLGNEDSMSFPVQIANRGNIPLDINVLASISSEVQLQLQGFLKPINIHLNPESDTLFYMSKKVPRHIQSVNSFQINVLGFYASDGSQFGQSAIQVQVLSSAVMLPYDSPPSYFANVPGTLTLSAQNAFTNSTLYELNVGNSIYLPHEARLAYHTDASFYQLDPGHPYFRDTWVNYERDNKGITVGNINRNFDLNIYGRGATAYYMDTANHNFYEGGVMDNASNLLQGFGSIYSEGRAGWLEFRHQNAATSYQSIAVYQKDPLTQTSNILVNNDYSWVNKKQFHFSASLNAGSSSEIGNSASQKSGMLASFSINGNIGKWNISSLNTISSSYYPGQRKGAKVFSERLSYNLNKIRLWGAFNYYDYQPKFVSPLYKFASKSSSKSAELGLNFGWNHFNLSVSPNYSSSSSVYYIQNALLNVKISAWRMATQLSYNLNGVSIYSSTEAGVVKNNLTNKNDFQLLLNSNLHYKFFSLSSNFQKGTFYSGDALTSYMTNTTHFETLNIVPNIQYAFFEKRLDVTAGASYNYIKGASKTINFNSMIQYKLASGDNISASFMRYNLFGSSYSYNNVQLSYTKQLSGTRIGTAKNTLTVFFFKDLNNNGYYDAGDSIAKGLEAGINNQEFITGKDGKIVYKNIPEANYNISVLGGKKWYAEKQTVMLYKKRQAISIALHKTGTVEGAISYSATKYSYEVNKQKQGLIVKAVDSKGNTTSTFTDDFGHYIFYLPTGSYHIFIDLSNFSDQVDCSNNGQFATVFVDSYKAVNFNLNIRERKIETKKFYSSSLSRIDKIEKKDPDPGSKQPK